MTVVEVEQPYWSQLDAAARAAVAALGDAAPNPDAMLASIMVAAPPPAGIGRSTAEQRATGVVVIALLRGGRAPFKKAVSAKSTVSVDALPWRESLIGWLRSEAASGRPIYLVTAADSAYAQAVCERLGFFAGALSSDGALNLKAKKKARRLVETFGQAGFDYIGDARADIPVWRAARRGICVTANARFVRWAGLAGKVDERFTGK